MEKPLDFNPEHTRIYILTNETGLHGRAVGVLSRCVHDMNCEFYFLKDGRWHEGILELICLGAKKGQQIKLGVVGKQAAECLDEIGHLFVEEFKKFDTPAAENEMVYF